MNTIDSNKIADLKKKFGCFGEFIAKMSEHMTLGTIKYGDTWVYADLANELEQEVVDVAVYAYLLWLRLQKIKEKLKEGET